MAAGQSEAQRTAGPTLDPGGKPGGSRPPPPLEEAPRETAKRLRDDHERKRLDWIRERATKLPEGTAVLDIGFDVPAHREIFAHCQYNFFDLRALLESARDSKQAGRYRIPVPDQSFDVVLGNSVFEWALRPEDALAEVGRVLKAGGLLWVAPPAMAAPADAPPRTSPALSFAWYAATFAKQGLEIGDAFGSAGLFGELSATCIEAGERLGTLDLEPTRRSTLEGSLLRELPLLFADLERQMLFESPRASIILEARRPAVIVPLVATSPADEPAPAKAEPSVRARVGKRPLRVTYLITSILGVTGGNMTLLNQVEALRRRGHEVGIVTYSARPTWTEIYAPVTQVTPGQPLASRVPKSDVVVATYFQNAHDLPRISAPVKIYYAQGDQFVFDDDTPFPNPEAEKVRQALKASSRGSYRLPGVHLVANSRNLADAVKRAHGVSAEAVLPVCTDQSIFRPIARSTAGSRLRILVVGPDTRGSGVESLLFKGIGDIRSALELVGSTYGNFTAVRVSNTPPDIFQNFPCEFHLVPSDEMKTFLFGTADVLVYASHFDSCPRPPQEGMAAGAAVVCTATSGAKEYCVHEQNCLLVPIKNPRAIADAILRLVQDRALLARIVEGGRSTAAEYPREREHNELEALFYRYAEAAKIV